MAKTSGPTWFFYEDLAPFQQYTHSGRVALVDVRTGRVTLSGVLSWPPSVNGQLPAFLRSIYAYDSAAYRVFYRPYAGVGSLSADGLARAASLGLRAVHPAVDSAPANQLGSLLASEHACIVRAADLLPGGYHAYARISQSRAALDYQFRQLGAPPSGLRSFTYSRATAGGSSLTAFVARQIVKHGCKDVLLYLAGGGYRGGGAVNIGMRLAGGDVVHQDITLAALRSLIVSHRNVHFEIVIDAPHASGFQRLGDRPNVVEVATPAAPGGGSFTYLPEARVRGNLIANHTDPLRLLQLTDRLRLGVASLVGSSCEVSQARSMAQSGKLPSVLAYLIARSFDLGGAVDFVARSGVGFPPQVRTKGFTTSTLCPTAPVVTASPDSYATTNAAVLTVAANHGVLANDSDSAANSLAVDELNESGGTAPFTGASAKGAAVTLNADGSFSYDPTGSTALGALARGQTTTDTFTYRANDGHGGTATATVTITVTGAVNHPPVAKPDAYAATSSAVLNENAAGGVLANDTDPDADTLTVDQVNGTGGTAPFSATTGQGASVTVNADGSFSYDPTGSAALQALARGQTTTDTFTYRANDGHGGTATAAVTITVVGANHPPVAKPDGYAANNNAVLNVNATAGVLANDTDADNDTLSVDQLNGTGGTAPFTGTSAQGATVTLNADGSFTYDPTASAALHPPQLPIGSTTPDTFTYEVSDGHGGTATATVTITVTSIDTPPTAASYTVSGGAVGNTLLEVGPVGSPSTEPKVTQSSDGIMSHASDPDPGDAITVTAFDTTSAQGGDVSVDSATGAFTYRPKAGFTGTDSFHYTVTDTHGMSATATITINVSNIVWYVKNDAAGAHDGRSGSPFGTLASAESTTGSAAGDFIYVFRGDGTNTGQDAGITLKANQTLMSEEYDLVVGGLTLATGTPANRPVIGNSAGNGVTLASADTVKGFDITGTGSGNFAIAAGTGDASGTIADNILHGAATAGGLTLAGTSGTWSVSDLTATGTGGAAFDANAAGMTSGTHPFPARRRGQLRDVRLAGGYRRRNRAALRSRSRPLGRARRSPSRQLDPAWQGTCDRSWPHEYRTSARGAPSPSTQDHAPRPSPRPSAPQEAMGTRRPVTRTQPKIAS